MSHIIPCSQTALHLLFFYKGKASKENSSTTHKGMFLYCSYQKYSPALLILFLKSTQYWRAKIHPGHDGLKILEPRLLSSLRVSQTTTSTYCQLLASRSSATPFKSFFSLSDHTEGTTGTHWFIHKDFLFSRVYKHTHTGCTSCRQKNKSQEEAVNYSKHCWLATMHIECWTSPALGDCLHEVFPSLETPISLTIKAACSPCSPGCTADCC